MARFVYTVLIAATFLLAGGSVTGGEPDGGLVIGQRDSQLRAMAVRQAGQGDPVAALRTLAAVKSPHVLAQAIRDVDSAVQHHRGTKTIGSITSGTGQNDGGRGGAIVDFGPLVNLIQTTIAPDSWQDTVGGPSTIVPYVAGIIVDPSGLITDVTTSSSEDDLLENIAVMLARDHREQFDFASAKNGVDAWRLPSAVRCVSLRGVADQIARRRLSGQPIVN